MSIEISAADVRDAEDLLASVLSEEVENGRFTDGTALRDLAVKALAVVSAQMRKENRQVQSLQSLLRIKQVAANTAEADLDPAVIDGTDAILSNWFLKRKAGGYSRGIVQILVNRKQDYVIRRTDRFNYDRSRAYYIDSLTDLVIPSQDVRPLTDATGAVVAYAFTVRLIAAKTGENFDVSPGTWAGNGGFSPFVLRVTSSITFSGGKSRESTTAVINRAENAIAVRNLINPRSVLATLTETFTDLSRLITIGMGDLEMQRDRVPFAGSLGDLHLGGYFDVYMELPVSSTQFEGPVGGVYARPDGKAVVFKDAGVPDWTTSGVYVGDVIRVVAGLPAVPRDFVVQTVAAGELTVSPLQAFPEVSLAVEYSIYRPLFGPDTQIYPLTGTSTTGQCLATTQTPNMVLLPPEPHYDILDVAVLNPFGGDPYVNSPDGYVHFTQRVNALPVLPTDAGASLPFRVVSRAPLDAQSSFAFDLVEVPEEYDGYRLRVTYQTTVGFGAIDSFVRDRFQRVLCANAQPKAYHPIYLTMTIPYELKRNPTALVNELTLRQNIVAFINSFDPREVIDVSDIMQYIRNADGNIGSVLPFEITYTLLAPDGRAITFLTDSTVSIDPAKVDTVTTGSAPSLEELLAMSVSDRTVRYLTRLERIQVELR